MNHDLDKTIRLIEEGAAWLDRRRFLGRALAGGCLLCGGGVASDCLGEDAPLTPTVADAEADPTDPALDSEERFVADARFWETQGEVVVCQLCPRECKVPVDERGFCGVRENRGGDYKTLIYARPCSLNVDPIEKKPLFHFLPGTKAFSLATAGCNIECLFCQNWQISQMRPEQVRSTYAPPERIVELARQSGSRSIAFTYTEPVIFFEYMFDVAAAARPAGLHPVMISNGYIQPEPMKALVEHLSAVKIDLKAFTEKFYRETCRGELGPVLQTLELLRDAGTWFEIVVLIVPTLNDGEDECRRMCRWIKETLGPDVPIHFTRFHPTYKIQNLPSTPPKILQRNREIATAEGLHYAYVGNVAGDPGENTYCHGCGKVVIERYGYYTKTRLKENGLCPDCGKKIPGVWGG